MKTVFKNFVIVFFSFGTILFGSNLGYAQSSTVTDADGNIYKTVKIGNQTWMVENLRTTHFNDGSAISSITGGKDPLPAYSVHKAGNSYGNMYNWYAVKTGKLAPKGWHIPTEAEWKILEGYLGGSSIAGEKMRMGIWPNNQKQNTFNVLPTGYLTNTGTYAGTRAPTAYWWASTEKTSGGSNGAECRRAYMAQPQLHWGVLNRGYFMGVRCVKD